MLKINLITYTSDIQKKLLPRNIHAQLINELEKEITINCVDHTQIAKLSNDDLKVVFLSTGGVEQLVVEDYEDLPHPLIIMADGLENSLASAMELMFWLHGKGAKYELLHGDAHRIAERLKIIHSTFHAMKEMRGKRIGIIGTPSPWLVASDVDYLLAKRRWGINFEDIQMSEITERIHHIPEKEAADVATRVMAKALAQREPSAKDILNAASFYLALKEVIRNYKLDAFTLSCYRIIELLNTTGCLGISLLNDEGILSGCEGDMQSVFSLLIAKAVTGKIGFMANTLFIEEQKNDIILGHSTVGLKQTDRFVIRNHIETGKGVSIQGILPEGNVTIMKCGNESLDNFFVSKGRLEENTNYVNACRTQVRVHLSNPVSYFFNNPLGNHHILINGDYEQIINEFLTANSCKRVM
jgi:L-fucose isomerase-like protein